MMIAGPPPPPQLTGVARPSTTLVALSKPFLQPLQSNYYCCYATKNNVLYNKNPTRAFPRLSLSISQRRNNESLLLFTKQLQQLCLSAFPLPPLSKTNTYNNKSRFLSLALSDSYYDDMSHIKDDDEKEEEEEEEEEEIISSALLNEEDKEKAITSSALQEVPLKIPPYLKLVTGLGFAAQLFCSHVALTIDIFKVMFTNFMSSPTERCISEGLTLCTVISTGIALERYAYVAEEHRKVINGPSKLSPQCDGESLKERFNDGMLWNLIGTCLAILVMRNSCYSLKRYQELGIINFLSILKSFTPGSLVVALEVWPFQSSAFFLLSHLLGLACSLCCYDQRDPNNLWDVAKLLWRGSHILLCYIAVRGIITKAVQWGFKTF